VIVVGFLAGGLVLDRADEVGTGGVLVTVLSLAALTVALAVLLFGWL
jgi:hypothetical protein